MGKGEGGVLNGPFMSLIQSLGPRKFWSESRSRGSVSVLISGPKGRIPFRFWRIGLGWGSGDPRGLGTWLALGHSVVRWAWRLGWSWDSGTWKVGKALRILDTWNDLPFYLRYVILHFRFRILRWIDPGLRLGAYLVL